jgi:hypothetical protein
MKFSARILGVALLGSSQLFAASIDFKVINGVFKAVADEAVKLEQVKDKAGMDLIDRLEVKFGEKSDISTGTLNFVAGAHLNGATWAPTTPSSLSLGIDTKVADNAKGVSTLTFSLGLALKSDTAALVRFAVAKQKASDDPCTADEIKIAADLLEQKFQEDACVDYAKLGTIRNTTEFLNLMQSILEKRAIYLDARLKELALTNNTARTNQLKSESPYIAKALAALKSRTKKGQDRVKIEFTDEAEVFGSTKVTSALIDITPTDTVVGITLTSPEGAGLYEGSKKDLEDLAQKLSLDDSDPIKAQLVKSLRDNFRGAIAIAKEVVLPK